MNKETIRKLAQYDTPTICNAIELFEVQPATAGFMDGRIKSVFPELPPMVGFACTAAFRASAPPSGADAYGSLPQQLEKYAGLPGPAVMVFQDLDDPPVAATFGEVMCTAYKTYGSAGLVTSGAGRDLLQVRALNYPVFTGSTICAHGYCHILQIGSTVRVGGLTINHGDLLHGDANGVTKIPLDIADEVPDVAAEVVTHEKIVLDYMRCPGPKTVEGARDVYKEVGAVFQKLRERVKRRR